MPHLISAIYPQTPPEWGLAPAWCESPPGLASAELTVACSALTWPALGEIGAWAGISGERGLITGQQSEIRPRSEQISAELPALIRHQAFPQSRLNFCDQDSRSTISNLPVTRLWSVLPSFYLSSYNSRLGRNRQIKNSIPFHSKSSIKI